MNEYKCNRCGDIITGNVYKLSASVLSNLPCDEELTNPDVRLSLYFCRDCCQEVSVIVSDFIKNKPVKSNNYGIEVRKIV